MAKFAFFCLCISAICVLFTYGKNLRPNHQQLIDSLQQYEFIEPRLSEPFIVQSAENVPVEEKRFLSFYFQGQFINILLTVNRNLLSPNFFIRHVTDHGQEIINEVPRNCFFYGYVVGQEDTSIASISSCDGIEGYFTSNDTTFSIEPVESLNGEVFNIVFESEPRNSSKYKGYLENTDVHGIVLENTRETRHRTRRNVVSETKYVELLVVNDASQYKRYGSKTSIRAIETANHADSTFRAQNIRVILIMVEIWKDADQIESSTKNSKFLSNFIEYKRKVLDINETTQSDHAMLITQKPLENGRHGWARIGTICTPNSASLLYDSSGASISGAIMAHELGHSFGFYHINSAECPCGDDNVHKCLMNADVTYSPLKWSNCTLAALRNILEDDHGTCLFNLPKNHYMSAVCGNGLIDKGEECDCGTEQECERWGSGCCNRKTCKLHPGKECDSGSCCENCTIRSEGSLCREKVNDCDLPEFCDGKSPICAAADSYVHDGRMCHVGQEKSICYLGVCHSYNKQCEEYWGDDAFDSEFCYNNLNALGIQLGFCKLLDDNKYMKCKRKDVRCGKLQCMMKNNNGRSPINGGTGQYAKFGGSNICWSGKLNLDNVNDGGMVNAGAMCGENKVCFNNTCLNVNEVYSQNECPNNCSGNGICNQHGHCHCNPGYGCPNCSEKCDSEGGSIDSGNNCYCPGPTTTPKTTEVTEPTLPQTTGPEANRTTEPAATSRAPAGPTTTPKTTEVTEPTLPQTTEPEANRTSGPEANRTTGPEANRTIEPVATSRAPTGNKEKSKERSDVVVIVVPVVLVIVIIIVIVIFIFYRQQILGCVQNSRSSSLQKTKSENYRVSYPSEENLADSNTPQVLRENPYENTPQFTSISFVSDSKIDSQAAPDDNSATA